MARVPQQKNERLRFFVFLLKMAVETFHLQENCVSPSSVLTIRELQQLTWSPAALYRVSITRDTYAVIG